MQIQNYREATDLWLQFEAGLYSYLHKRVRDADRAAELNQEVLRKVLDACCSGRTIGNVRSWLFQIAHHAWIDARRQHPRRTEFPADLPAETPPGAYRELSRFLEPLLTSLPEKYALPLRLADLEGHPQQAVADQLGLSLSATKSRIQRARQLLKKEIENCFHLHLEDGTGLGDFQLKASCTPLKQAAQKKS